MLHAGADSGAHDPEGMLVFQPFHTLPDKADAPADTVRHAGPTAPQRLEAAVAVHERLPLSAKLSVGAPFCVQRP